MTDDEVETKFLELAAGRLSNGDARRVAEMCWDLEQQDELGTIVRLCEGPPR